MNSLEMIRTIKAKAAADQAAAQALDDLLYAKRDALMAPFASVIEELGHLVTPHPSKPETTISLLSTSMTVDRSIHNHHARFEVRDSYSHVVSAGVKGENFTIQFYTWHRDVMGSSTPREATSEQALDHLLQYIATHYEEPSA